MNKANGRRSKGGAAKVQEAFADAIVERLAGIFAKSFAIYTAEVLRLLEAGPNDTALQARSDPDDELASAPEWVRAAYRRASKIKRVPGLDHEELRARLLRSRLGVALKAQGMTQAALAGKLRKSESQVSRILRNPERARLKTLTQVADAIGVDLSDILQNLGRPAAKDR
jgi:DNA-binding phage protein